MVEATTTYFAEFEDSFAIVKNVHYYKCKQCGEVAFTGTVVERLEQITAQLKNSLQEVNVVNYSAA